MREHVVVGDIDTCFMEITHEDEGFHIEVGSPVASFHDHLTVDELRDLVDVIEEMME